MTEKADMPEDKKYTLDELVGKCDPSCPLGADEEAWLAAAPVGEEVGSDQGGAQPASSKNLGGAKDC